MNFAENDGSNFCLACAHKMIGGTCLRCLNEELKIGEYIKPNKEHVLVEPTGKKFDSEKPRMELLSSIAMIEISKVMTHGAKKYDAHNWRGGIAWSRVIGAAMRHLAAFNGGEDKDPETGLSHLAHASCCLMFLLEYEITHSNLDDRFKK